MTSKVLGAASLVLILVSLYLALVWTPNEAQQGIYYRIIYFHVPVGIMSYLAAFLLFAGSALYLIQRDLKWDRLGVASAEMGFLFCSCSILTGMIWAKPIWGVWWVFDARLTAQLLLWLIFVAYFMLRAYLPDRERRAKLAGVFGLLGMLDVPINYKSIEWWTTQHPQPVMRGDGYMDPDMRFALNVSIIAFIVLYAYLMTKRLPVAKVEEEVDYLHHVVYSND